MRLLVITNEPPYPPNAGGRLDQWTRMQIMRQAGAELMLVSWLHPGATDVGPSEIAIMGSVFDRIELLAISRDLPSMVSRLVNLPRNSPHVSTRTPSKNVQAKLTALARDFAPDAVLLDALYGGVVACRLAEDLRIPLIYRAQNIEYLYMRQQARQAATLSRKAACLLAGVGLRRFEQDVHRRATLTLDISEDDRLTWIAQGFDGPSAWLPPLMLRGTEPQSASAAKLWDVVFLGNLNTPNNVRGLIWFIEEVAPLVRQRFSNFKLRIAGSKPSGEIRRIMAQTPWIDWVIDAKDANEIWASGKVLINPILAGSGVNVKSVEMLFQNATLVTTSLGVRGFPDSVKAQFVIGDTPAGFAEAICSAMAAAPEGRPEGREAARSFFGNEAGHWMMDALRQAIAGARA